MKITEQFPDKNGKYMYENFDEYAEIMGISKDHPNYETYQLVWNMARTHNFFKESDENLS